MLQAVHGWSSTYERFVKSQNFFSSYLTQEDMSRLGRDYLKVGQVMEILRQRGVRLIAINDGVDSLKGDDDFTPFRNIMNEFYARDTSRKIRSVFKSKGKQPGHFLSFEKLLDLFRKYDVLVGTAHPYRAGGHIPELPREQLERLDFLDLNGKDVAEDRECAERLTRSLGERLHKPVVSGSDTHQAVQYGCIWTEFEEEILTLTICAVKSRQAPIRLWFRSRPRFR